MFKDNYIHAKTDKSDLIKKYYIAILPLIIFSIYKNGIVLFSNDLINIIKIGIPIYFYLISIAVGYSVSLIRRENSAENILICLIIACSISINTNMLIYPILLFVILFIIKFLKDKIKLRFNEIAFIRITMILSLLINSYSYLNIGEKLNKFDYNMFDIFIGHGTGGIATTSLIAVLISFIILSLNKYYKKVIPIFSSITYIIVSLSYMFLTHNFSGIDMLLNGTIYFSFVFIAADLYTTPYNKKAMAIYGTIVGILSSIFSIFCFYEAGYISILICSLLIPFLNKIYEKTYLK